MVELKAFPLIEELLPFTTVLTLHVARPVRLQQGHRGGVSGEENVFWELLSSGASILIRNFMDLQRGIKLQTEVYRNEMKAK